MRKSSILFESWVEQAGGTIKGSDAAQAAAAERAAQEGPDADAEDDEKTVVPFGSRGWWQGSAAGEASGWWR